MKFEERFCCRFFIELFLFDFEAVLSLDITCAQGGCLTDADRTALNGQAAGKAAATQHTKSQLPQLVAPRQVTPFVSLSLARRLYSQSNFEPFTESYRTDSRNTKGSFRYGSGFSTQ